MALADQEVRLARVTAIRPVAVDTLCFELAPGDRRPFEAFSAGSHIDVHAPNGAVRQYSLCGDPADPSRYAIAVKKDETGRGGSLAMHRSVEVGGALGFSGPRNHFPLAAGEGRSLLIAGGIGITPVFAMIRALAAQGRGWELHYCARSEAHAAFRDEIEALPGGRLLPYFSEAPLLDVAALLREVRPDTDLYYCGPAGLMKAVAEASRHWPEARVHFEYFSAPVVAHGPDTAFEVELARSGEVLAVPADRTLLQVVREHGIDVTSSCEEGVCGTCETRVLGGECDHRDVLLSASERAANNTMMICVSRSKSPRLVLDL